MGKLIGGLFVGALVIFIAMMALATLAVGDASPLAQGSQYRTVQQDVEVYEVDGYGNVLRPLRLFWLHKGDTVTIIIAGASCIIQDEQGRRAIVPHGLIGF